MKNTITQLKDKTKRFNSRVDKVKERSSELKDREFTPSEHQKKKE